MKVKIIDFIFLATYNEVHYDSVVSYKKFTYYRWQLDSIFWKNKILLGTNSYYVLASSFWNLHFDLW